MQPLSIGILSDSHRTTAALQRFLDLLKSRGATHLLHAGDFHTPQHLQMLHDAGLPYAAVFGNNDAMLIPMAATCRIFHEPHYFSIEGIRFKLMHMPFYLDPEDADIVIYGHTHQVKFQYNEGVLVINPGEVCARDTGRYEAVLLDIFPDRYRVCRLFFLDDDTLNEEITEFIR